MNNVIYVLSGILIVLSLQLAVRSLRRRKNRSENIWHVPVDTSSRARRRKRKSRAPLQPQIPPPVYMFKQR